LFLEFLELDMTQVLSKEISGVLGTFYKEELDLFTADDLAYVLKRLD
jgi:hypothetical protein